ncbi:MAG: LysM peptidoglycan-binding domain-containing protein [Candidatus Moranbacteria bacterium]|nr:LysM peptidoglycan-binding domain-containing protein [Candidatus Moranbacteria bacterium]
MFRNYSALSVVVGSAFLVTGTNVAATDESGGFLSGYFQDESGEASLAKHKIAGQASKKDSLSLVPLASASTKVDPEEKDMVLSVADMSTGSQGSQIVASSVGIMKDPEEDGGVSIYTVKEGDTVSGIAAKNFITVNTILWANDLENVDAIKPGDQIFILPVAGVTHTVQNGETLDSIAQKYHADKGRIIAFNELPANGEIKNDQEIVIPDGQKEIPKPTQTDTSDTLRRQYATSSGAGTATDISSGWKKLEGKAGTGHRFPYGYCTWYVAQKRYVPWGGNAGTWLYNAKAQGYKTGKSPTVGSIVVTTDSPYYGHVALVESVGSGTITVSEMNYKGWGKVNRRVIPIASRSIKGYVY